MLIHELTPTECRDVLSRTNVARLACSRAEQPYVVPVSFAYDTDSNCLFSFSTIGKKVDWMRENPKVCVEVEDLVVVEQEAVSHLMMFSKRVHLVLEITEGADTLRFRDRSGRSFARYEGSWQLCEENGQTVILYALTAQPSFDVPQFLLKRLLKRDAGLMIAGLRREIAAQSAR